MAVTAQKHEFKAETQKLLDLMIHSLYSNKEIFLRELISNASDALDRLRFEAITHPELLENDANLEIRIEADPEARTLTIHDNGIGMSKDEVVKNIGTIAHSGTRELLDKLKERKTKGVPPEFIGQFGVGFYSSFMAAKKVVLVTRRAGDEEAVRWESTGDGTYKLGPGKRKGRGTSITLYLRDVDAEDGLEDFTSEYVIGRIVKKYSDFVTYPIKHKVFREEVEQDEAGKPKEGAERTIKIDERTLNSMKALWERPQAEVSDKDYEEFYHHVAHDWTAPAKIIRQHAEGVLEYHALLFIPAQAPRELYFQAFKSGLQLYVKNVKIIEECEDLLPRYLRFVRGVVDSPVLPLNVSREMLQQTREIAQIRKALTKKVLDTLSDVQEKEPEAYLKLWAEFGRALKEGIASDFDNRDRITKLLLFQSSHDATKLTTLGDYVSRMKPGQESLYYITGESRLVVENLPHLEAFRDKGYEVLFLVEPVDELMLQYLNHYENKSLKSVGKGAADLGDEKEKEETKKEREEQEKKYAGLFELMQKRLDEHVKVVRLSNRLTSSPVCLVVADHDYSPFMEKLLLAGKGGGPKARRIMEINPKHPILDLLEKRFEASKDDPLLGDYAEILLDQALMAEGGELTNPVKFSRVVTELMVQSMRGG